MTVPPYTYERMSAIYAMSNIKTFPTNPRCDAVCKGKNPLTENGFKDATDNLNIHAEWAERHPKAMVGLPTGEVNQLLALDEDPDAGGTSSRKALEHKVGPLPQTATVSTINDNGIHHYYRCVPGLRIVSRASDLGPGLDVRAEGGYTIAPGSRTLDGREYRFTDGSSFDNVADLPAAWAFEMAFDREEKRKLAVVGVHGSADFDRLGVSIDTWQSYAASLLPELVPAVKSDVPLSSEREARLKAYLGAAFDDDLKQLAVTPEGKRDYTANRTAYKMHRLLRGAEFEGLDTAELEAATLARFIAAVIETGIEGGADLAQSKWLRTRECAEPRNLTGIGARCTTGRPVLKPSDPYPSAELILTTQYQHDGLNTLIHTADSDFLLWEGTHYERVPEQVVRNDVYRYLDGADRLVKDGDTFKTVRYEPNNNKVANVVGALQSVAGVNASLIPPAWLVGAPYGMPPASEMLPVANGLLHIKTRKLFPHTPAFLHLNAVPYAYDPKAASPVHWLGFLESIWKSDLESQQLLKEWFGYCLTLDTRQQKMLLMVGSKRGGKGTIGRIQREMVGPANVAGPTLSSLGGNFGLEPLLDKQLAIVSDARMGKGALTSTVLERLLTLSGEDAITVDRKHEKAVHGRLTSRIVIISNELPNIPDASGALASRFLILNFNTSFLGREDMGLEAKLLLELPGILNWALDGLASLTARGRFIQPQAASDVVAALEELTSPVGAFIRDACVVGVDEQVSVDTLYDRWRQWCRRAGEPENTKAQFGQMLNASISGLRHSKPRLTDGSRQPTYVGVGLQPNEVDHDFADMLENQPPLN